MDENQIAEKLQKLIDVDTKQRDGLPVAADHSRQYLLGRIDAWQHAADLLKRGTPAPRTQP